jgi:chromodomain-helicase-DNA-binding protein 7
LGFDPLDAEIVKPFCKAVKKKATRDEAIATELAERGVSKWAKEDQYNLMMAMLKCGTSERDMGEWDYDGLRKKARLKGRSIDDVRGYILKVIDACSHPEREESLVSCSSALRVIRRLETLGKLNRLLKKPEQDLVDIVHSAPPWKSAAWSAVDEVAFYRRLKEEGISSSRPQIEPETTLLSESTIRKRIEVLYEIMMRPPPPEPARDYNGAGEEEEEEERRDGKKRKRVGGSYVAQTIVIPSIADLKRGVTFPVNITPSSQILELGKILPYRDGFHTERYIYPAGFKSSRLFASVKHPDDRIMWISEIADIGKKKPLFKVYSLDQPNICFSGDTPSKPWVDILKAVSAAKKEKKANTISGPEAFLLANPIAIYLIQQMPGSRECAKYKWREVQEDAPAPVPVDD